MTHAPKDVLVVDDEEFIREVYKRILRIDRYEFDLCTNGADAVERVAGGQQYRVALVDYLMPDMNGLETAAKLREHDSEMRIVFVTGILELKSLTEPELRAEILTKPFTPQDLRQLLRRLREEPLAA